MRFGIMLSMPGTDATLDGHVKAGQLAERQGFASAWLPNVFALDALTTLAIVGRETERIELGTAVVPTYPRHPSALAQQALTTQAAARGRLALGIGLSHQVVIENMFGLDYSESATHAHVR
jgi:alkanesulfonate monooxygenase SsuD/methylene tetrahydromethanopterin reductase-like flavin-dependent oxidoreductase (luciferase family)